MVGCGARVVPAGSARDPEEFPFHPVEREAYRAVGRRLVPQAGADVQTLLWGPLATSITKTIGETVGVVRDDDFTIGLRPLTDRAEGA
ncbi:hypothetical protein [Streptomyces sp. MZ04]|uniref:hypothetical protein n=1 Tax=Streptomyces sp. MZ04 TaxID=2559236 RepID=UPI00107E7704|nr:hypothetical protein [Streptomyces sp. MZ04]TGB15661.1 hypothetical protein E2651_02035 [Streptomyces sp. MZ04]